MPLRFWAESFFVGGGFTTAGCHVSASFARYHIGADTAFNYDADGRADLSVHRPSNHLWYLLRTTAGYTAMTWGEAGDLLAPADYDGDGKTDIAVFWPATGVWYIVNSGNGAFVTYSWGADGDLPVPADHNADGRSDLVLFRQSNGMFYRRMSDNSFSNVSFGVVGDKPVIGDFDNDGQCLISEFIVRRITTGTSGNQRQGSLSRRGARRAISLCLQTMTGTGRRTWRSGRSSNGRWYGPRAQPVRRRQLGPGWGQTYPG